MSPLTAAAMPWRRVPVPWVPVAMAPLIVCRSMSPRFGRASPSACSAGLSTCSGVPASTRTRRRSRSIAGHAAQPVDVQQQAVGRDERRERVARPGHPHPLARVDAARRTASATAARPTRRAAPRAGVALTLPPQLRHSLTRSSFLHRGTTAPCRRARPRRTRCTRVEPLEQLAGLGAPHPDPVPDPQPVGVLAVQRGLHLARSPRCARSVSPRRTGRRHPRPPGLPARDVAAAEGRDVPRRRVAARPAARRPSPAAG